MTVTTTRRGWTREEVMVAINLYCKIPFGKIHNRNPKIIELAAIIGRTPSAVSWKLANFAHLDPSLAREGASNVSRLDREIWVEFFKNWNELSFESERLLGDFQKTKIEPAKEREDINIPEGKEKERLVKTRVNQSFFRQAVLASYNSACCITGISEKRLLIASHIVPWAEDEQNRTNPRNGLCLNSLHDKAFDAGLLTIDAEYRVVLGTSLKQSDSDWAKAYFLQYHGAPIHRPQRFLPEKSFLEYHRSQIFVG